MTRGERNAHPISNEDTPNTRCTKKPPKSTTSSFLSLETSRRRGAIDNAATVVAVVSDLRCDGFSGVCIDGDRVPRQFLYSHFQQLALVFLLLVHEGFGRRCVNGNEWAGVKSQDCLVLVFILSSAHEPIVESMDRPYLRPKQR